MIKICIVDDEEIIRDSIAMLLRENIENIHICGICKNGIEAYDTILNEDPDIVITDIMMPAFSGLDLVEWVTKSKLLTKFIILSGFDRFEYAKKALELGVANYLLKPCNNEELINAVENLIGEIKKHKNPVQEELIEIIKNQSINNILSQCITTPSMIDSMQSNYYMIDFDSQKYTFVHLQGIENLLMQFLNKLYCDSEKLCLPFMHLINTEDDLIVFFHSDGDNYERTILALSNICKDLSINLAKHNEFPNLNDAIVAFIEYAKRIVKAKIIYGYEQVEVVKTYTLQDYINAFRENDNMKKQLYSAEILQKFSLITNVNFMKSQTLIFFVELNTAFPEFFSSEKNSLHLKDIHMAMDCNEIWRALQNLFNYANTLTFSENTSNALIINKVISYINEHISDEDLTLKKIAETYLYMNANYLSQQFLKHTGMKFSAYLNARRIQLAKEILMNDNMKVYHVAECVGCGNNPQYFSQIFKKHTGHSPTAYAKQANMPE